MTETIVTDNFECQDDQWRTVTVLPCNPEGSLRTLWAIFKGTYKPSVKVQIEDHPDRRHHLWDTPERCKVLKSPLVNHTPLTRDTIEYGDGRHGTTIKVGKIK